MVHSWNAKYRRPNGLIANDYRQPIDSSMLWVYEGLTNYLGDILAARSGLWTPEQFRDFLAWAAATLSSPNCLRYFRWTPTPERKDSFVFDGSTRSDRNLGAFQSGEG